MKLTDKIQNNFNYKAIVNDKEFQFRPWKTKEEKEYLLVSSTKEVTLKDIERIFLETSIKDYYIQKENLSQNEKYLLFLEIRKISVSDEMDITYKCSNCGQLNSVQISLDDAIHYKKADFKPITINNKTFYFGNPKTERLQERVQQEENPIEKKFLELLIHISKIEIDGDVFENFKFDELYEYISNLEVKEMKELEDHFEKIKEELDIYIDNVCLFCNEQNKVLFGEISDFF